MPHLFANAARTISTDLARVIGDRLRALGPGRRPGRALGRTAWSAWSSRSVTGGSLHGRPMSRAAADRLPDHAAVAGMAGRPGGGRPPGRPRPRDSREGLWMDEGDRLQRPGACSSGRRRVLEVRVRLAGRFEPVDGRYHWAAGSPAHDRGGPLVRDGRRAVTLQIGRPGRHAAGCRGRHVGWSPVRAAGTAAVHRARSAVGQPRTVLDIAHRRRRLRRARHGDPAASSAGIDDFVILERADDVGGTWRDNTYPGCALRRAVAPVLVLLRAEPGLVAHVLRRSPRSGPTSQRVADRYGVRPHLRFGTEVTRRRLGRRTRGAGSCATSRGDASRPRAGRRRPAPLSEPVASRTSRASTRSRARRSTPRAGTTTTT